MKKFVALMLISGFVSISAEAAVGRNDGNKVDCSKVIQSIQEQMKRSRPAGDAAPAEPDSNPNARPAQ